MGLSKLDKISLEEIIDDAIAHIDKERKLFGNPVVKKSMHIGNVGDFLFGMVYGEISTHFEDYFNSKYQKMPNEPEVKEIIEIISSRLQEIHDATSI